MECSVKNPQLKEGIILDQHISSELLISNCIVKVKNNNRINLTVLNVSEKPVEVNANLLLTLTPIDYTQWSDNKLENNSINSIQRTKQLLELLKTAHLNSEEYDQLREICSQYADIFHLPGELLTCTDVIQHEIKTTSSQPIHVKSYRFPEIHKEEVKTKIGKMLNENIIRPSKSTWSSPVWIVPKKLDSSGQRKWRIVIIEN